MLDFVILQHDFADDSDRTDHWDLMLRDGDELLTWAIEQNPLETKRAVGKRLPNHRLRYLNYEGPISDDRGTVQRIAVGKFRWLDKRDLENWTIEMVLADETVMTCSLVVGTEFQFEVVNS